MKITNRYIERSIDAIDALSVVGVLSILVAGLLLVARHPALVWVDLIVDDAYYYLGIARNLVTHGASSFMPPFDTNGYQPLWTAVLTASAFVFGTSSTSLVVQIYVLSFVFLLLFCVASRLRYGIAFPAIAASAYFYQVVATGMETTMVPVLFVLYFSTRRWPWRGVLGSLLFLSRLDALSVVVVGDLVELIERKRIDWRKYLVIVPVLAAYAALNLHYFDTPVPVSGLAKAIGNVRGENYQIGLRYFAVAKGIVPVLIGLVAYILLCRRPWRLVYWRELTVSGLCTIVCAAYYGINSGWQVWGWYFWPVFMFTYYVTLEAATLIREYAAPRQPLSPLRFVVLLLLLLIIAKPAIGLPYRKLAAIAQSTDDPRTHLSYGRRNIELVSYLQQRNVPHGAFFAMGDRAGSFGFFLGDDYRFIHTEGLVGPYSYYQAMRRDEGAAFIDGLGLDYLVVDRGRVLDSHDTIGVIEPVQPLSSRYGDYVLCFRKDGIVLDQSYYWGDQYQRRYLIDYRTRTACPAQIESQFLALRERYAGVMRYSLPDELR